MRTTPHIVLVVLDTARADCLTPYGAAPDASPRLARIAREGTVYTRAISSAPWTVPAHASLFTGLYTSAHGVDQSHPLLDGHYTTLAEVLRDHGYYTVGVSSNTWLSEASRFSRGFNAFFKTWQLFQGADDLGGAWMLDRWSPGASQARFLRDRLRGGARLRTLANGAYLRFGNKRYDYGARRANRFLRRLVRGWPTEQPLFLFVNYLEPHLRYWAPRPYRFRFCGGRRPASLPAQDPWGYLAGQVRMTDEDFAVLRALYQGEIAYTDAVLGQLYDALAAAGILDDTIFIVTSDHGESLGEHGLMDHQYGLYEQLLRVPFVIRAPRVFQAGTRVDDLVQPVDVLPTLLRLLDLGPQAVPQPLAGVALEAGSGRSGRETAYAEYLEPLPTPETLARRYPHADFSRFSARLRAIYRERWKYVASSTGRATLHDLATDPGERRDLLPQHPALGAALAAELAGWVSQQERQRTAAGDAFAGWDPQTRAALEGLGYLT
jgi:arylsulfatase A-like enzyme